MGDLGCVYEQKGDCKNEGQEETDHPAVVSLVLLRVHAIYVLLGGDILACWNRVGNARPARKDTTQAYRDELAHEVKLNSSPDDTEDASQDHHKVLAVYTEAGSGKNRIADVIACRCSAIEHNDTRGQHIGKKDDQESISDCCA